MGRRALLRGFYFLCVCKPDSHSALYNWVNLLQPGSGLHGLTQRVTRLRPFQNRSVLRSIKMRTAATFSSDKRALAH